jgi:hypothetical protein
LRASACWALSALVAVAPLVVPPVPALLLAEGIAGDDGVVADVPVAVGVDEGVEVVDDGVLDWASVAAGVVVVAVLSDVVAHAAPAAAMETASTIAGFCCSQFIRASFSCERARASARWLRLMQGPCRRPTS